MNTRNHTLEAQRQALAEHGGERRTGDMQVDAYRLVHRAVRLAPMPPLPADFATRVAAAVRDHDEGARMEAGFVIAALLCAAVAAAVFAFPIMVDSLVSTTGKLPNLPWPMLLTAAIGLIMVGCVDRLFDRQPAQNA